MEYPYYHHEPIMLPLLLLLFSLCLLSLSLLVFSLYGRLRNTTDPHQSINNIVHKPPKLLDSNPTHLAQSLLFEILPGNSPKWATLLAGDNTPPAEGEGERVDSSGEECAAKRKKKRRPKKKRSDKLGGEDGGGLIKEGFLVSKDKQQELVCLYPFTSSSSATQRKIKQQYDQLVKSHESNGLTLVQVGQFVNCLIEARNELQHKSEVIQRKFTITKALLFKADRSSFDRLRQQIYKLELEQKRLEEDAFVYNWLQQQLKLSPAYKKILEIGACMELKGKSGELVEDTDTEFSDISFEEFLAREKKDSFWQKKGKPRSCSS